MVSATCYASVLGLGFGDCGKGHFIDALTRLWQAHTVVRFNGGAQAGHNVVTSASANSPVRHHTFSQFGAGTLVPGVRTLLVDPMIIHPSALLVEAEFLSKIGVVDALSRLTIDAQCRITTPFHQAAGRLREILRGAAAHGTCGVGVGETVRHALEFPGQELRYADLTTPQTLLGKLQAIREALLVEFLPLCPSGSASAVSAEFRTLQDEKLASKWMTSARALARHNPPALFETIRNLLEREGCVLFEGAQGVLLDEWRGFHPHTSWSSINTKVADAVIARFGLKSPIEHYGVMRTYLTRHGAGSLPTYDQVLDGILPEPHNSGDGWQGIFRRGHPDGLLLRYAFEVVGRLSGLLVSHMDVFQNGLSLKWCERYFVRPLLSQWPQFVDWLPVGNNENLEHQVSLTRLLQNAHPEYGMKPISSEGDFLDRIAQITSTRVAFCSYGPTFAEVRQK
jgi:adenylosuccinate synthase